MPRLEWLGCLLPFGLLAGFDVRTTSGAVRNKWDVHLQELSLVPAGVRERLHAVCVLPMMVTPPGSSVTRKLPPQAFFFFLITSPRQLSWTCLFSWEKTSSSSYAEKVHSQRIRWVGLGMRSRPFRCPGLLNEPYKEMHPIGYLSISKLRFFGPAGPSSDNFA